MSLVPNRMRSKRSKSKKPMRQRQRKNNTLMKIPTSPPNFQLVKLKYCENFIFTLSSVNLQTNRIFRINDLYDPNYTTTGHQPYFRDQMFALYTRARVLSSKILVQFAPNTNQAIDCILCPVSDGAVDTDYTLSRERKGSKGRICNLGALGWLSATSSTSQALGVSSLSVKTDDKFIQYANGALDNSVANWWQVGCNLLDPAGTSCNVMLSVKIDMITLFSDPVQQSGS